MSILPPLIRQLGRLAVLVCLCVLTASAQQSAVRIGMVLDGPAEQNARLLEIFEEEIRVLVEGEFEVEFPAAKQLVADWTAAGIAGALDGLLSDPDVDYIVTLGILGSNDVSRRGPLPKPVFAAIVLHPEIQGVPSEMLGQPVIGEELEQFKVSGVPNLSYVTAGGDAVQEIRVFRGLVPFSRLTILYMEALSEAVPNLRSATAAILGRSDLDIDLVPVGASIDEAVAAIPANAEAIFVTPLWHLSSSDFDLLADALIERRLPSFSTRGREDVEQGILATLRRQENYIRRARRVALNIQEVLAGADPGDLAVEFSRNQALTINMATARAIGVSPTFYSMTEAELLNEEPTQAVRTISLADVMREASRVNTDLLAADQSVAAGSSSCGKREVGCCRN